MIKKKHIHTFEVISVLLLSLLANYIFDFKHLDFRLKIDWIALIRFFLLSTSAVCFNIMLIKLKEIEKEATDEFLTDFRQHQQIAPLLPQDGKLTALSSRQIKPVKIESISDRFSNYFIGTADNTIKGKKRLVYNLILTSLITFLLFFLIEPVWQFFSV